MVIGSPHCDGCVRSPTFGFLPCGHTTCMLHYLEDSHNSTACGHCGADIRMIHDVSLPAHITNPPHITNELPVDPLWGFSGLPVTDPNPLVATGGANNTMNGNGIPPDRPFNNFTSMPTPGGANNNANGPPAGRYVPPQLREPIPRPDTGMSNASFDTQPPMPSVNRHSLTPLPGSFRPILGYPSGLNSIAGLDDPFIDAPRAFNFPAGGNFGANPAFAINNGPAFGGNHSGFGQTQGQMFTSHGNGNSFTGTSNSPSNHSSAHDSARANVNGVDLGRAATFANMIRAGYADDPTDIDYGNPGRSKRLPPEPVNAMPTAPKPRGKVLPTSKSTAMISYNDANATYKGNAAPFLGVTLVSDPSWFYQIPNGLQPSVEEVMEALPMIESCRLAQPPHGISVIRITNIPYASSRSEIIAFLGRNTQIVSQPQGSPYHAVHIMMDRQTAKTMDAYVELKNAKEAEFVIKQFKQRTGAGRSAKIGDREVQITELSQGDLMAELFPSANIVGWDGPIPVISKDREEFYPGVLSAGFKGFLRDEELTHLSKFAETPQRSPFAQRCPIRSYEHLITLLHKYPWYAIDHVLLKERHDIFQATLTNIRSLMGLLRKTNFNPQLDSSRPTLNTLQELVVAALTCPGFSEGQKALIAFSLHQCGMQNMASSRGMNFRFGGTHPYAKQWPFHALVRQPGSSDNMMHYIATLLQEATADANANSLSLTDLQYMRASGMPQSSFGGNLNVDYGNVETLADLGRAELRRVQELLGRVLPPADSFGSRAPSSRHS